MANYRRKQSRLTPEQIEKERAELDALEAAALETLRKLKEADPFWFYEPSDGSLTDEGRSLLRRWLKPGDVPEVFEGQRNVHLSTASIVGASGGNQVGKSLFSTIETLIKVTKQIPFAMESWYPREKISKKDVVHYRVIAEDYTNGLLKNVIPTYRAWVPREYLIDGSWEKSFSDKKNTLTLARKGRLVGTVEFMSNQQDLGSFQGPARDGLVFDEEPLYDVYQENLMRLTTAERTDILFAMTPTRGMTWLYDKIASQSEVDGKSVDWFRLSTVTNKKANLAVLEEILGGLDSYEKIKMRLLGEFISLSGLVYGGTFNSRVHVIKPFDTGCTCGTAFGGHPEECGYAQYVAYVGIDPHMVKDSTMALCVMDREGNFIVDTCYKRSADTEDLKKDYHKLTKRHRVLWSVFDPSSDSSVHVFGGMNIFKLCTSGAYKIPRAHKADKFHGSIAAGVDAIKQRLRLSPITNRPTFYIMNRPENQELIRSFKTMERDSYANEDVKGQKDKILEGVHDHHACVRYVLQNRVSWRPMVVAEPQPVYEDSEAILL